MNSSSSPPSSPIPKTMQAFTILPTANPSNPDFISNGALVTVPVPTIPPPPAGNTDNTNNATKNLSNHYALIQIHRAGICNTDLELLQGYMNFHSILGHEFVGRVVQLHDDESEELKKKWVGKMVCGDINLCCGGSGKGGTVSVTADKEASAASSTTNDSSNGDGKCTKCHICNNHSGHEPHDPFMARNHCPHRSVLGILNQDGTFAEYMLLPLSNLHMVPEGMKDEIAVFAEPLAAAARVVEQGLVQFIYDEEAECSRRRTTRGGDRVAILGDGKLGLCVAEILGREYLKCMAKAKCKGLEGMALAPPPALFGKHQHKLDFVKESGVKTFLLGELYQENNGNDEPQLKSTYASHYDVVIDATGNPQGLTLAMSLTRPMGTLILKSTCAAGVKGFHSAPIVIDELKVVGSRCGPIDVALEILKNNDDVIDGSGESESGGSGEFKMPPLRMEKYITKTFPLSQAKEALEFAALKSTMKVQLVMVDE